jgi:3-hydroxyisobutyrate dehydrogenase-like beta-hydroxyacid dehydrogenase
MDPEPEATTVAVIGLGAMGARIAQRLLDAGRRVVVWNRSPERMTPLVEAGASGAESPAGAASRSDVVITMVSTPEALLEVTEGREGAAAGLRPAASLIQMATVGRDPMKRLASLLPDGARLVDAPVLGSISEASSGSLQIFVGGEPEVVERWTPLLSALGSPTHVGPVGAGQAAKLVANLSLFGVLAVLGEALGLARHLDLSLDAAFAVLATTPLAAQAERRRPSIENREYPSRFALSLARKDAGLIAHAAGSASFRLAQVLETWFADASEDGWGSDDYSRVLDYIISATGGPWKAVEQPHHSRVGNRPRSLGLEGDSDGQR